MALFLWPSWSYSFAVLDLPIYMSMSHPVSVTVISPRIIRVRFLVFGRAGVFSAGVRDHTIWAVNLILLLRHIQMGSPCRVAKTHTGTQTHTHTKHNNHAHIMDSITIMYKHRHTQLQLCRHGYKVNRILPYQKEPCLLRKLKRKCVIWGKSIWFERKEDDSKVLSKFCFSDFKVWLFFVPMKCCF